MVSTARVSWSTTAFAGAPPAAFWSRSEYASNAGGRRIWLYRRLIFSSCGSADLLLEIPPGGFGPAVSAGNPGGSARVDPAVERFVPLPQLLPFEAAEAALGFDRDQLFTDELLHPFRFGPARQMHVASRVARAGSNFFICRR